MSLVNDDEKAVGTGFDRVREGLPERVRAVVALAVDQSAPSCELLRVDEVDALAPKHALIEVGRGHDLQLRWLER